MHLLVHKQHFTSDSQLIRFLECSDDNYKENYFKELQEIYNETAAVSGESQSQSSSVKIFYNAAAFMERLLCDLKFKNFKGHGKLEQVAEGVFKFAGKSPEESWFQTVFVPYVQDKLKSYLVDQDEPIFLDLEKADWNNVYDVMSGCLSVEYTEYEAPRIKSYTLLNCMKEGEHYIPSQEHLLAVIYQHIWNNMFKYFESHLPDYNQDTPSEKKKEPESEPDPVSDLEITEIANLTGIQLNKVVLTDGDIIKLIRYILGDDDFDNAIKALAKIIIQHHDSKHAGNIEGWDSNSPFDLQYALADTWKEDASSAWQIQDFFIGKKISVDVKPPELIVKSDHLCQNAIDAIRFDWKQALANISPGSIALDAANNDKTYEHIFYKNSITHHIVCREKPIQFLNELQNIKILSFKTPVGSSLVKAIDVNSVNQDTISALRSLADFYSQLISPIEGEAEKREEEERIPMCPEVNPQLLATKAYVDKYKNDLAETLASTVIDNVSSYLSTQFLKDINKTQISKDLINLGVKKTRKAKGFVYGIEDEMKSGNLDYRTKIGVSTRGVATAYYADIHRKALE